MDRIDYLVFLVCSERSGSNLLLNMLDANNELTAPIPPHIFRLISTNVCRYGDLDVDENWNELLLHILKFTQLIGEPWRGNLDVKEITRKANVRTVDCALNVVCREELAVRGGRYLILKENEFYRFLPFLILKFPTARYIWQVRDPRDMLASFKRSSLFTKLLSDPVGIWQLEQQCMLNVFPYLAEAQRIYFQRYEDLIRNPESSIRELCSFIGVEFDDSMLNYHNEDAAKSRARSSSLRENVSKPVMSGNCEKYIRELDKQEIVAIETRVGDLMEIFGYKTHYFSSNDKDADQEKRQKMILSDTSTTDDDRRIRADRVGVIREINQKHWSLTS